jgi:Tol biopolymer transport system component
MTAAGPADGIGVGRDERHLYDWSARLPVVIVPVSQGTRAHLACLTCRSAIETPQTVGTAEWGGPHSDPAWSPTGNRLSFTRKVGLNADVWTYTLSTAATTRVKTNRGYDGQANWR